MPSPSAQNPSRVYLSLIQIIPQHLTKNPIELGLEEWIEAQSQIIHFQAG
jgi:hypothetical protein